MLKGLGVVLQGGGSMAEASAPAADGDAATASGSAGGGRVATVVLRASTDNLLDDLERAIDDGVNNYKVQGFELPCSHEHHHVTPA